MSVFRVKLQNVDQGLLDVDMITKAPVATSNQRQAYIMGPGKINRLLKDGETFTDNNYWKQFAYPQMPYEHAFIEVVSDDGSVYSDVPSENTFGVGKTFTLATEYNATNVLDFVGTYGQPANFLQITNEDTENAIVVELNGDSNIVFTLGAGETQMFNTGDLAITLIRLKAAAGTPTVSLIGSVRSVSKS